MTTFYPFIHNQKKKEQVEQEFLYIELINPHQEQKQQETKENDSPRVIVIDIL